MPKLVIARNGVVVNLVNSPDGDGVVEYAWRVADDVPVSVGDAFDPRDYQVDAVDTALLKVAFNHENRIRVLEGKSSITQAQFRNAVKALL